jgi:hypothetical protein
MYVYDNNSAQDYSHPIFSCNALLHEFRTIRNHYQDYVIREWIVFYAICSGLLHD